MAGPALGSKQQLSPKSLGIRSLGDRASDSGRRGQICAELRTRRPWPVNVFPRDGKTPKTAAAAFALVCNPCNYVQSHVESLK